ncbi:hypothetical protein KKE60_05440 [Patescibacteria group bacterium]|nr:hypothetical protein [Patescibacteria group bacterium]
MALIDGDDFLSGDIFSFQEANRIKNNFRGAAAPTGASEGMLFSDEGDDKLWHRVGISASWDEVLQETLSAGATPEFNNLILDVDPSDVSSPPTDAELEAIFPVHPNGFMGFVQDTTSGGSLWMVVYNSGWWYIEFALAV